MPSPFKGCDFLGVDSLLSDDEKLVRETVRRFVQDRVIPIIEKHNRESVFPGHLVREMGRLGILGATLQGYGCAGLNALAYGLIMQELERGDSGLRSFASVQGGLAMNAIHSFGSEDQKRRWLPPMASGEAIGCFGLTEPDFGSNPSGLLTRATATGNGYLLNGSKAWITNGGIADIAIVWAKCDDAKIRGFLVEKGSAGFQTRDYKNKLSFRSSVTSELMFHDCHLPAEALLAGTEGIKSALRCLNEARYGIAWGVIGAAMDCYHTALVWALERKQFAGKPIASHQLVQEKLVWMLTEISKAQLLNYRLGRLKEAGRATAAQISLAKRNNVSVALETARSARDILGANGILDDYPVFRHLCNLETVKTYEGTHDIHTLILGQHITGIAAFE